MSTEERQGMTKRDMLIAVIQKASRSGFLGFGGLRVKP